MVHLSFSSQVTVANDPIPTVSVGLLGTGLRVGVYVGLCAFFLLFLTP